MRSSLVLFLAVACSSDPPPIDAPILDGHPLGEPRVACGGDYCDTTIAVCCHANDKLPFCAQPSHCYSGPAACDDDADCPDPARPSCCAFATSPIGGWGASGCTTLVGNLSCAHHLCDPAATPSCAKPDGAAGTCLPYTETRVPLAPPGSYACQ